MNRRDALFTFASAAAASALTSTSPAFAAEGEMAKALTPAKWTDDVIVKPLPFDAKKLHGLSEKLITSHWENNYGGSVKTLNALNKRLSSALADKDYPPFAYDDLKREHLLRTGSVVLHELYFGNLGGNGKSGGGIERALKTSFGDMNTWETEFRRMAQGLGGGSGWVVLGYNFHLNKLENYWAWDHMHFAAGSLPLLVMDMYEHSYQMDFGAAAAKYVDAFFQNIQWEAVQKRFENAATLRWS